VESAQFVHSLKLKNAMLAKLAVDATSELVHMELIVVSGGTNIKITPLGREILEKEGRLDSEEKSTLIE
jgi:predicted transcriptional regulator